MKLEASQMSTWKSVATLTVPLAIVIWGTGSGYFCGLKNLMISSCVSSHYNSYVSNWSCGFCGAAAAAATVSNSWTGYFFGCFFSVEWIRGGKCSKFESSCWVECTCQNPELVVCILIATGQWRLAKSRLKILPISSYSSALCSASNMPLLGAAATDLKC